ncbi:hypothetical protein PVK06_040726 [Gossypium arboreum]|uniref:RNase H type-1 domain-containing protein n=1 Tax=Gossypium arboreum TaxID=29729 RepID=A0ABR0N6A6_GOSAR|nr:hypothetical protein PVK06_040726 [Gossypium arboreum]
MVVRLKEAVSSNVLIPEEEDRLIWIHDSNRVFCMEIDDKVRCGGVLRDSTGVARALFFGLFVLKDFFAAEMGAISMALDLFLAMGWKGKSSLIIEVRSIEVFSWVENKGSRPWLLYTFFKEIEIRLSRVSNVSFSKAEKHGNKMAFTLACRFEKAGYV